MMPGGEVANEKWMCGRWMDGWMEAVGK